VVGIVGQANHLQKAFFIALPKDQAIQPILDNIITMVDCAYELDKPSREDVMVTVILQTLSQFRLIS